MGFAPLGCASVVWHYYGVEVSDQCYEDGKLLGPTPAKDLPLTVCKPDAVNKGKCVVMLQDEYFRLLQDDKSCQISLKACQGG